MWVRLVGWLKDIIQKPEAHRQLIAAIFGDLLLDPAGCHRKEQKGDGKQQHLRVLDDNGHIMQGNNLRQHVGHYRESRGQKPSLRPGKSSRFRGGHS